MSGLNIFKAVSVRLCFLFLNFMSVWRVTVNWNRHEFWFLLFTNIPFIVEGVYTVQSRKGIEWKWMCPCFLFFLLSTVPNIWLLEISSMNTFSAINRSAVQDIVISGVAVPLHFNADTWTVIVEEALLYLMILGRWFLPRGEVSREQLSELLFEFLGIASDIMELFALFDEDQVRSSKGMTYALLAVWSWSIIRFVPLIITKNQDETSVVRIEIIGICVNLLMQDIPFLVMRLYTMIMFQLIKYSLVFFSAKNVLVILLMWYRFMIICTNTYCRKNLQVRKTLENNNPLVSLGLYLDNYIEFDNNETSINDEEKDEGESNGTPKPIQLMDSEYGMKDSRGETSPEQLQSKHKKDLSPGQNVCQKTVNKEETYRRKQSASTKGMGKHDSVKSYGISVQTENNEPKPNSTIIQVHF